MFPSCATFPVVKKMIFKTTVKNSTFSNFLIENTPSPSLNFTAKINKQAKIVNMGIILFLILSPKNIFNMAEIIMYPIVYTEKI